MGGVPVGGSAGGYEAQPPVNHYVCSWACFDRWASGFMAAGQPPLVSGQTCTLAGVYLHPAPTARAIQMYRDQVRAQKLQLAGQLVQAEDFEAAAKAYQEIGMWKEAGEVRRRSRRQVVTQVQVNVNELVDQIRKAGISTDYTCPACKGHIRISGETSLATLTTCEYCGSAIQTTDLVDFLTNVVGYR